MERFDGKVYSFFCYTLCLTLTLVACFDKKEKKCFNLIVICKDNKDID